MEYRVEVTTTGLEINYKIQYKYKDWRKVFGWFYLKGAFDEPLTFYDLHTAKKRIDKIINPDNKMIGYAYYP